MQEDTNLPEEPIKTDNQITPTEPQKTTIEPQINQPQLLQVPQTQSAQQQVLPTQQIQPQSPQTPTQPHISPNPLNQPPPQSHINTQISENPTQLANISQNLPQQSEPSGPTPQNISLNKKSKMKWVLPVIFASILILGSGVAAYVKFFQKTPEKFFSSALNNTYKGIDKFLSSSTQDPQKGFKIDGNFKISSPIVIDGSIDGQWYESDGFLKTDVGASGVRITNEIRTIKPENADTPDIYLMVDGLQGIDSFIKSFSGEDSIGLGDTLSQINGNWYSIDHTLLDQYLTASNQQSDSFQLTDQDIKKIIDNMSTVVKDRLFNTDEDKAVFQIEEKFGEEKFEDTQSYKMKVKINKDKFKDFITALKDASKDTKLEELLSMGQTDKSFEEILQFENLLEDIEKTDFSKAFADVWIEKNGYFIRNIRIYTVEGSEASNYIDLGLDYKGDDVFPLSIKLAIDESSTKGSVAFGININQKNGDVGFNFDIDIDENNQKIIASGKLNYSESDEQLTIEKPVGAQNLIELINGVFGGIFMGQNDLYNSQSLYGDDYDSYPINDLPLDDYQLQ